MCIHQLIELFNQRTKVESGSLEKPKNVVDRLQIRDVQVEEVMNGS